VKPYEWIIGIVGAVALVVLLLSLPMGSSAADWGGVVTLAQVSTLHVDLARQWPASLAGYGSREVKVNGICLGLRRQDVETALARYGFISEIEEGQMVYSSPLKDAIFTVDRHIGVVSILLKDGRIPSAIHSEIVRWDLDALVFRFGQYDKLDDLQEQMSQLVEVTAEAYGLEQARQLAEIGADLPDAKMLYYSRGFQIAKTDASSTIAITWPGKDLRGNAATW